MALVSLCLAAELPAAGELDLSFNPTVDGEIQALAVTPDGKIMIGGTFNQPRPKIARLLANGQADETWGYPSGGQAVPNFAVLGDGGVVVGSTFQGHKGICRFKANGAIDNAFNVSVDEGGIRAMSVDVDGNLLLGGDFDMINQKEVSGFAVVGPDGIAKGKYYANPDAGRAINTLLPRADRSILLGGDFTKLFGNANYAHVGRMTSGAILDSAFRSPFIARDAKSVSCLAVQHYEVVRTVAGGNFNTLVDITENRCLARISNTGAIDLSFSPVFTNANGVPKVNSVVVQADGRIIAAGNFTAVNGISRMGLVRLEQNGSVDTSFVASAVGVNGLALQADGKVLVTGTFQQVNGVARNRIARLHNSTFRDTTISVRQSGITWPRNGPMPESDVVTFEVSTDAGKTWQMLKQPTRSASNWIISSGIKMPASGLVRGRARVASGLMNSSSGLTEKVVSYRLAPEISVSEQVGMNWVNVIDGQATPIDLGEVVQGSQVTKSFRIYNPGTYELNVEEVQLPAGFELVDPPAFPATVAIQGYLGFTIRVDGSSRGPLGGTLVIKNDDGGEDLFDIPLAANVVGPEIALRLQDGELSNGQAEPISFVQGYQGTLQLRENVAISNQGNTVLSVSAISATAGFTVDNPQPFLLQPGENRAIQVGPDQTVAGALTGNLEVYSDDFDEPVFRVPLAATVVNPLLTKVVNTKTTLNRKTGLREQKLRIMNTTKIAMVEGFRVIVRGLPEGVVVRNASEVLPDGSVVIVVHQPLGPGGKLVLVLEYEVPKGAPTVIYPQLVTEVIVNGPKADVAATLAVEKSERTRDGHFALTFRSVPGRVYQVEYSPDGKDWKASPPTRAAGSIVRWVDCGCPQTECAPKDAPNRLYRVRELE